MRSRLRVHTAPASPYSVALARLITCAPEWGAGSCGAERGRQQTQQARALAGVTGCSSGWRAACLSPGTPCPTHLVNVGELEDDLHRPENLVPASRRGACKGADGDADWQQRTESCRGTGACDIAASRGCLRACGQLATLAVPTLQWPCHPSHRRTLKRQGEVRTSGQLPTLLAAALDTGQRHLPACIPGNPAGAHARAAQQA